MTRQPDTGTEATLRGLAGRPAFRVVAAIAFLAAGWWLYAHVPYRIDIDVYRMGGRAWLNDQPLYAATSLFHTRPGINLPFTYPPLAAIFFAPFAWLPLPAARLSLPAPPNSRSAPLLPNRLSLPSSPSRLSLPLPPVRVSLPPRPNRTSLALPPTSVLAADDPVRVAKGGTPGRCGQFTPA